MVVAFIDIDFPEELGDLLLFPAIDVFLQGGFDRSSFAAVISDFDRFFEQFLCDIKVGSHVCNYRTIKRTIKPPLLQGNAIEPEKLPTVAEVNEPFPQSRVPRISSRSVRSPMLPLDFREKEWEGFSANDLWI